MDSVILDVDFFHIDYNGGEVAEHKHIRKSTIRIITNLPLTNLWIINGNSCFISVGNTNIL